MPKFLTLDPNQQSTKDNYKLLIGCITPRPIAWVSTVSDDGALNLAPFSFFNGVCAKPPTLLFCPTARGSDGAKKDTLRNIEATGEFVVNVVTEDTLLAMNETAGEYPPEVSEFEKAGLTPSPSVVVKPPRVLESPVSMECKLNQIIRIGDGGVGSGNVVIGTIVYFHVREDVYDEGRILTAQLKPVGRLAGAAYCTTTQNVFDLERPTVSPSS